MSNQEVVSFFEEMASKVTSLDGSVITNTNVGDRNAMVPRQKISKTTDDALAEAKYISMRQNKEYSTELENDNDDQVVDKFISEFLSNKLGL